MAELGEVWHKAPVAQKGTATSNEKAFRRRCIHYSPFEGLARGTTFAPHK